MKTEKINTLIFDFGGVLYDIDPAKAYGRFKSNSLRPDSLPDIAALGREGTAFTLYETGRLTDEQFRESVSSDFSLQSGGAVFDKMWNSLLVGVNPESLGNITELSRKYRLLLLSNTNPIHFNKFEPECRELFGFFEKLYLSFELGLRKPNREIYDYIIKDSGIIPKETIFIDDSPENANAAAKAGLNAVVFTGWQSLMAELKGL